MRKKATKAWIIIRNVDDHSIVDTLVSDCPRTLARIGGVNHEENYLSYIFEIQFLDSDRKFVGPPTPIVWGVPNTVRARKARPCIKLPSGIDGIAPDIYDLSEICRQVFVGVDWYTKRLGIE